MDSRRHRRCIESTAGRHSHLGNRDVGRLGIAALLAVLECRLGLSDGAVGRCRNHAGLCRRHVRHVPVAVAIAVHCRRDLGVRVCLYCRSRRFGRLRQRAFVTLCPQGTSAPSDPRCLGRARWRDRIVFLIRHSWLAFWLRTTSTVRRRRLMLRRSYLAAVRALAGGLLSAWQAPVGAFVITAYPLKGKPLAAYRRRRRRKGR